MKINGKRTPDLRKFERIPGEMWISSKSWKTRKGAEDNIYKMSRTNEQNYEVVVTRKYFMRPTTEKFVQGTHVFRIAVRDE